MDMYAPPAAGPQGIQGPQGAQGNAGANGTNGANGAAGAAGPSWPFSRQRVTPTTGQTVNADGSDILQITPAGLLLTLTVVFPASPTNLKMFLLASTQTLTTLTLNGNGNTVLGTLATLAIGGFAAWYFSTTDASWVRCG